MERIELILGDITKIKADAIVNAANTTLLGGGGVDGAIHRSAGKQLLEECKTLGGCKTGQSKITKGYNLPAKYVIHTVGPVYNNEKYNEAKLLESCYITSLELMIKYKLKTIAFPSISTGAYRYPIQQACKIAINTVCSFIKNHNEIDKVYFVCFSQKDFDVYKNQLVHTKLFSI